ncbi:hypothetical protein YC2023_022268 [Brassica napus]
MHKFSDLSFPEEMRSYVVCKVEYTSPADSFCNLQSASDGGASTSMGLVDSYDSSDSFWESLTKKDWVRR